MPWIPIKNFDEDVRVGDSIRCGEKKVCGEITAIGLCNFLGRIENGEATIKKEYATHVWREPKRWRAEKGEKYCFIELGCGRGIEFRQSNEDSFSVDDADYQCGNYFKPGFLQEKHRQALKDLFAKFHEEENV